MLFKLFKRLVYYIFLKLKNIWNFLYPIFKNTVYPIYKNKLHILYKFLKKSYSDYIIFLNYLKDNELNWIFYLVVFFISYCLIHYLLRGELPWGLFGF